MEWLDKAEQVSEKNLTIDQAVCLIVGMSKIHDAGVLHDDAYPNNAVVIPGTTRGIWLDFFRAKLGAEDYYDNEMTVAGVFPIQLVSDLLRSSHYIFVVESDSKARRKVTNASCWFLTPISTHFCPYIRF